MYKDINHTDISISEKSEIISRLTVEGGLVKLIPCNCILRNLKNEVEKSFSDAKKQAPRLGRELLVLLICPAGFSLLPSPPCSVPWRLTFMYQGAPHWLLGGIGQWEDREEERLEGSRVWILSASFLPGHGWAAATFFLQKFLPLLAISKVLVILWVLETPLYLPLQASGGGNTVCPWGY